MLRSVVNWLAVSTIVIGLASYFAYGTGWIEKSTSIQLVAPFAMLVVILDIVSALRTRQIFLRGVVLSLDRDRPAYVARLLLSCALLAAGAYGIAYTGQF